MTDEEFDDMCMMQYMGSITNGETTLLPAGFDAAGFTMYPATCNSVND